jgi:hypothetical protein
MPRPTGLMTRASLPPFLASSALLSLALAGAALASGCGEPPTTGAPDLEETSQAIITDNGAVFDQRFDASRKIRFTARACFNTTAVAHPTVSCPVGADDVLIGGSAHTTTAKPGVFLTASYPDSGLTKWTASSKDHGEAHPHNLFVFSFGLNVAGMTPAQLRQALSLVTRTSAVADHPKLQSSSVPSDEFLLSTGGKVNWSGVGNLLTGVWPTSVAGKDHVWADPASITMYELRIKKTLRIGTADVAIEVKEKTTAGPTVDNGFSAANVRSDSGFAPAGAFGYSVWWNPGRLMIGYGYHPGRGAANGYETWTSDHLFPAKGQALAGMTEIRVKQ